MPATPLPMSVQTGCEPGQIDVNTASLTELAVIVHIGQARAEALVELRPFSSLDDLARISGIGPARIADIKAEGRACVSGGG